MVNVITNCLFQFAVSSKARKEQEEMTVGKLIELSKIYVDRREDTVEAQMGNCSGLWGLVLSPTKDLEIKDSDLQTVPVLLLEIGWLLQDCDKALKEIESCGAKLTSLQEVGDEITLTQKEVTELRTSVSNTRELCLGKNTLARKRDVEMQLSKKGKKILGRNET